MSERLFGVIEKVVSKRVGQKGRYTNKQLILDVMNAAAQQDSNMAFSNGDLRAIATKLELPSTVSGVRQNLSELIMSGHIKFIGRESRMNNVGFEQSVPVYRAVGANE